MNFKSIAVHVLAPPAILAQRLGEPWRRAWAHARLAAAIGLPVDPSVVILGVAEIHGSGHIRVGRNLFLYRGLYLETQEDGAISIGDGVVISRGVHIVSFARVEIEAGVMIGEYSSIRDANHRLAPAQTVRYSGHNAAPIVIERNAWLGRGVTVLPGVTIGAHAVVGANAVITRDVPQGATVAGIPAKPLVRQEKV
jgi:acetyltransferase-like isoleucine patch superfamily enzyme